MTTEEKLMYMFTAVQGEISGSAYTRCAYDNEDDPYEITGIDVTKDSHTVWNVSKTDILFDYMTRDLEAEITGDN